MMRRVTSRHTITIPKRYLEDVGADVGTYFEITSDGSRIVLTPKEIEDWFTEREWARLDSLLKERGRRYSKAAEAKAHVRRLAR